MSSVVKERIHSSIAESILNELVSRQARYYYFLGRTLDFTDGGIPSADVRYEIETRRSAILYKNITPADASLVIPRNNWTSGLVYEQYRTDIDEIEQLFYVLTTDFNVYKCLDNGGGSPSTVQPTGVSSTPVLTADGYTWQFMYSIPLALRNKFLTAEYMPVGNSLTNRFFSDGSIETVRILDAGDGYTQEDCSIVVSGDGAAADLRPVIENGQLVNVQIINPGVGYTVTEVEVESTRTVSRVARVSIDLNRGNLVTAQAVVEQLAVAGTIDSITVENSGSGYTSAPIVQIVGDGTGAAATAEVQSGQVRRIRITNRGSGYTFATVNLIGGGGVNASAMPHVSPTRGHGSNAIKELRARALMFFNNINNDRISGLEINNDYRQFGLLKNIRTPQSSTNIPNWYNENAYAVTTQFPVNAGNFAVGTQLTSGGFTYFVREVVVNGGSAVGFVLESPSGASVSPGSTFSRTTAPIASFITSSVQEKRLVEATLGTSCFVVDGTINTAVFTPDTAVLVNGARFTVINATQSRAILLPQNFSSTISIGNSVQLESNPVVQFLVTGVEEPTVDRTSGDLILIDNRAAFTQTEDQTVSFRTILGF